MKVVTCKKYGPPEVLRFEEMAQPVPKDSEILIKVKATTVAVADVRIRAFNVPSSVWLPARLAIGIRAPRKSVLGVELAGEVVGIGKAVTRFKIGDAVFAAAIKNFGAYAEYICLPENDPIALKSTNLSFEEAASLPIGGRTALHFLEKANLQAGQQVLIYGASGSVGTYAVQLARHFGAEVTGVCSHVNMELVQSLGAHKVLDYNALDFRQQLEQYDVVFLAIDKFAFSVCNQILKAEGVYVNITSPFKNLQQLWVSATSKKKIIMGSSVPDTAESMQRLKELVDAGVLSPVVDKIFLFDEIIAAHHYVDQGHKRGNVAISIAQ